MSESNDPAPTGLRQITRIAAVVFDRVEETDPLSDHNAVYVECRLIDPPGNDLPSGFGLSVSEAFFDMERRVFDSAVWGARLRHDDPEEWARRSAGTGPVRDGE